MSRVGQAKLRFVSSTLTGPLVVSQATNLTFSVTLLREVSETVPYDVERIDKDQGIVIL